MRYTNTCTVLDQNAVRSEFPKVLYVCQRQNALSYATHMCMYIIMQIVFLKINKSRREL